MEKESDNIETKDGHHTDLESVISGMDGIADMTSQTKDAHHSDLASVSGAGPMEVDDPGEEEVEVVEPVFCHFGPLLQNSKIPSECSEPIQLMSVCVKREKERLDILNRSGQFHVEDTSQIIGDLRKKLQ